MEEQNEYRSLKVELDHETQKNTVKDTKAPIFNRKASMVRSITKEYEKSQHEFAIMILNDLKENSITYRDVLFGIKYWKEQLHWAGYKNYDKYSSLFDRVYNLIQEEMNDLPATNRSEETKL